VVFSSISYNFDMDKQDTYQAIVDAVHLAVDAEQTELGTPYTDETERCLDVVYKLLREALGITQPPDA